MINEFSRSKGTGKVISIILFRDEVYNATASIYAYFTNAEHSITSYVHPYDCSNIDKESGY